LLKKAPMVKSWPLAVVLAGALVLRAALLAWDVIPFDADEAIVALMARHILRGARPCFFYGQQSMGSLRWWGNLCSRCELCR
jgi:hypothetical protein